MDIMLDAFAHLLCNYAGIIKSGLFVSVSDQKFQKKEAIESSIANYSPIYCSVMD